MDLRKGSKSLSCSTLRAGQQFMADQAQPPEAKAPLVKAVFSFGGVPSAFGRIFFVDVELRIYASCLAHFPTNFHRSLCLKLVCFDRC